MAKQTEIPTPGPVQVSVFHLLQLCLGEKEAWRVWKRLAGNPGVDPVANINTKTYNHIKQLQCKDTKKA